MKHLRIDYQGIQDTTHSTSIEDDELVFFVRAKDRNAGQTARIWAAYTLRDGGDPDMCRRVQEWGDEMDLQRMERFKGGKVADVPAGMMLPSNRPTPPVPQYCPHCAQPLAEGHAEDCPHLAYVAQLENNALELRGQ